MNQNNIYRLYIDLNYLTTDLFYIIIYFFLKISIYLLFSLTHKFYSIINFLLLLRIKFYMTKFYSVLQRFLFSFYQLINSLKNLNKFCNDL